MLERIRKGDTEEVLLGDKRREREKKIEGRGPRWSEYLCSPR
jgi:hypothetical protein